MMELVDGTTVGGFILDRRGLREGHAVVTDGKAAVFDGDPGEPDLPAVIIPDLVDCHTHCADFGLQVPPGMSLEELVAPPDGLKHRYLRESPKEVIEGNIRRFGESAMSAGIASFIDFREGGVEGCRMLREACPGAIILGRPVSPEFDPVEIGAILEVADGIGIPSISDLPADYAEAVADEVRSHRSMLAIHVSERVREDIDAVLSLDPAFVVHMCEASDGDIAKCAEAEVPIVMCPRSNAYFSRRPPAARAVSLGADVLLGTDNGMLCAPDMFQEASALMAEAEAQGGDPSVAWDVLGACSGKLLNRPTSNIGKVTAGRLAVMPLDGFAPDEALRRYRAGAFGMQRNR